jgi:hypothetical protein
MSRYYWLSIDYSLSILLKSDAVLSLLKTLQESLHFCYYYYKSFYKIYRYPIHHYSTIQICFSF